MVNVVCVKEFRVQEKSQVSDVGGPWDLGLGEDEWRWRGRTASREQDNFSLVWVDL